MNLLGGLNWRGARFVYSLPHNNYQPTVAVFTDISKKKKKRESSLSSKRWITQIRLLVLKGCILVQKMPLQKFANMICHLFSSLQCLWQNLWFINCMTDHWSYQLSPVICRVLLKSFKGNISTTIFSVLGSVTCDQFPFTSLYSMHSSSAHQISAGGSVAL